MSTSFNYDDHSQHFEIFLIIFVIFNAQSLFIVCLAQEEKEVCFLI